jgi:hypothetical protein
MACPGVVPAFRLVVPEIAMSIPTVIVALTEMLAVMVTSAVAPVTVVTVGFVPGEPPKVGPQVPLAYVPPALVKAPTSVMQTHADPFHTV